ncbi:amino acid adenylation domain protein [Kribbella flavida DSM 17836]|uniref:Amino acid adenylation domain protein n=1 Tax=Kribbella flavida (strain DSM 17836 / JCM 10339 / NBRC 14399) TaxID=479435 RepID=D2PSM7_KRIFD|nr:amino acid adenylation domain-containing protein [Kribbella flavida]ADB33165.1 amino acid adenylation domain protein [Kribbella flavida DSM 17836]
MESNATDSAPRATTLSERKQKLLAELRRRREHRPERPTRLHRLRSGEGAPVVLVHPVGGQVFSYIELVGDLRSGRPAYALEADEGLSSEAGTPLEELAANYWHRLEAAGIQPGVLAGWSFGGVLAYEMVRQGPRVPLVLIDSMPRPAMYDGMTRTEAQYLEGFFHDLLRSAGDPADLGSLPPETWTYPADVAIAMAEAALTAGGSRLDQSATELLQRYRVHRNATWALDRYTPEPADVPVRLIRAARWDGPNATDAWRALVGDENLVSIDVDADHYGILRSPAVEAVRTVVDCVAQDRPLPPRVPGAVEPVVTAGPVTPTAEHPEITLVVRQTAAGEVEGRLDFDQDRCDETTARALIEKYLASTQDAGPEALPHTLVGEIAVDHPDAVALRWTDGELTYRELVTAADTLASRLGGAQRVAVCHRRTSDLYIAILAVLRSGAAYVPIDPGSSEDRRNFVLADSGAQVLLCDVGAAERWTLPDGCRLESITVEPGPDPVQSRPVDATDLAYVMYTSGSTGVPKGVAMPHGPLVNLLRWQRARSGCGLGDRTLQFSAVTFDASFQEIFATWTTGGTLVLASDEVRQDPRRLLSLLEEQRINRLFLPFVGLRLIADAAEHTGRTPTHLREVITAGEQLRITPTVRAFFRTTGATLDNQYGPTESHVVTAELLDGDQDSWPELPLIGAAIDRAVVEVCDSSGEPVRTGETGELHLSGPVLADGYIGRPDLTDEVFVRRPGGRRTYRTGDIGRMHEDRRIEYLGRADNQVKISGCRVEPAEVECALCGIDAVADAVVLPRRDDGGHQTVLVGYLVGKPGRELDARNVREQLAAAVPAHLVPQQLLVLPAFPLGSTGKVDRLALAAMPLTSAAAESPASADVDEEDAVVAIGRLWQELLGRSPEPQDSFFELGGNSLSLALLAMRLEQRFGVPVQLPDLFAHNTLEAQVGLMERLFLAELARFSEDDTSRTLTEILEP